MGYLDVAFNLPLKEAYTYREPADRAVAVGCRVKAPLGRRLLVGWVVRRQDEAPQGVKGIREPESVVDEIPLFDEELLTLAEWLSSLYRSSLGETLSAMLPGGRREKSVAETLDDESAAGFPGVLTKEQEAAIESIFSPENPWSYLYGITGSGKTEVFLRAARRTLEQGRGVIYLVPEIALSHQLAEGIRSRFPEGVAVLHSGLTPSRRLAEWRRIQSGEARVVLGARSAVFAPVKNLGLVVMDEEHEGTYKSSSAPRYHARQVAMKRCRNTGARLVMGSATPSVEAWHWMGEGRISKMVLRERPAGGAPPEVRIVDLRGEKSLFSRPLVEDMSRVLADGRQVLLFLNRRGFSYFFSCRSCGHEVTCRSCSVPLTLHKHGPDTKIMVCHYCGYRTPPPESCPSCGSVDVGYAGFGTEKAEEETARLFPKKKVVRLDADAVRKRGVLETTLKDFREGRTDILLGTQMVAKGLNAPGVKLAAVLLADTTLNLPDFRAAERTFALVTQVAGRAGRFAPDGEVIVQTLRPEDRAVSLSAAGDMEGFYQSELEERRLLEFPPYSRLFRLTARGPDEERVRRGLNTLAGELNRGGSAWELLGPAECALGKIAGNYRRHIILKARRFDDAHAALSRAVEAVSLPRGVHLEIDIDPVSLL